MVKAEDFLNLDKKQAQDKCDRTNMLFRLISINGESYFSYPEDVRTDRVCIEITGNKVTKATIQ